MIWRALEQDGAMLEVLDPEPGEVITVSPVELAEAFVDEIGWTTTTDPDGW